LPGEIYVPDVASATVLNIAKALIGKRGIKMKTIGIRPGEKMHEVMVSEEEANHCVKRGEFYAIKSMLPELAGARKEPNALKGEFSSAHRILDYPQTVELLKEHRLLVGSKIELGDGELLR
jgi:UDP-glucose 4-epimerase